ncbi:hypothetical protein Belba_2860 [Belliella baltica DSM 15883]|uniref:Uncharacterized protein n=1 Tax=Belliella baltica (strain DSM 15883 / CIP 108006 / LMG 21964 / BA134) TaxID=866536 RepID=I3Z824_BELBD|nr:hypothetical protein [Belliella baltica]AFL85392.1 hypothetical protein Belba_2860 [Belliella baltica DSM 15883]
MNALKRITEVSQNMNKLAQRFDDLGGGFIKSKEDLLEIANSAERLIIAYNQNKELDIKGKLIDAHIKKMTLDFQKSQLILEKVFGERDKVLSQQFKVIDEGIRSGNSELMLMGMKTMTEYASNCPIRNFDEFKRILNDPNETLYLDF